MKKTIKLMVLTVPPNTLGGVEFATNDIFRSLEKVHKIKIRYLRNYGSQTTSGNLLTKTIKRMFALRNIANEAKRFKPDIVHINSSLTGRALIRDWVTSTYFKFLKIPVFLWFHGSNYKILTNPIYRNVFNSLISKVANAAVLSREELSNIQKFTKEKNKIIKISYFVDVEKIRKTGREIKAEGPSKNQNILFAGRFILKKGIIDTIKAFNLLKNRFPHSHLILAGDGPLKGAAEKLIKESSLEKRVAMTGHISEDKIRRLYRKSTVFVLPTSHPEGMPGGIINALIFGLPIITTKTRGTADFLKNNENCQFTPPHSPKILSTNLELILRDAKLRNTMRRKNLLLANKFNVKLHQDYFFKIYQKILDEKYPNY